MDIEYIIIYQNCGKSQTKHVIKPFNGIEYWDESKLRRDNINPDKISEILVGPMTVIELFSETYFSGDTHKIINDKKKEGITYTIGCPNDQKWKPKVGSIIIWTYEHYNKVHGIPYCTKDSDCKSNQMCLCKHGQSHPSWCPNEKRRCMNKGYFTYEFPFTLNEDDQIDLACYHQELIKVGDVSDGTISKALDRDLQRRCAKQKIKQIQRLEHFGNLSNNQSSLIILAIILICIYLASSR